MHTDDSAGVAAHPGSIFGAWVTPEWRLRPIPVPWLHINSRQRAVIARRAAQVNLDGLHGSKELRAVMVRVGGLHLVPANVVGS